MMRSFLLCLPAVALSALVPVYDYWDDVNKQHTFHTGDAWDNEVKNGIQFYAYDEQVEGTFPVHAWWDDANKQHTFHFEPAWRDGTETSDMVHQFYAFQNHVGGTDPVYSWWDTVNNQHTFHFEPAWSDEQQQDIQFYAFKTADGVPSAELAMVFDFWDDVNKQHTFHFPPAWKHGGQAETKGQKQFRAYNHKTTDTEAVYDFWDDANKQHNFHFLPAKDGESKGRLQFYAYPIAFKDNGNDVSGLVEIHNWWDTVNKQFTFHAAPAWDNEEQRGTEGFHFFAHPIEDPPTPVPTPATTDAPATDAPDEEEVTRAFGFEGNSGIGDQAAFLERCNTALAAHGVTCDAVKENEGDIEVHVTGSQSKIDLMTNEMWTEIVNNGDLPEVGAMIEDYEPMQSGDAAPMIGAKNATETDSAYRTVAFGAGVMGVVGLLA